MGAFITEVGIEVTGQVVRKFDKANNTNKTIVERTYVLGYSCCCLYAVPISIGGDITGTFNSAT